MSKHIVVLTGAGMSAESGVKTFRDHDGLWEGHDVMQVASPEGFRNNPALVLDFYNQRRRQLKTVTPNSAHKAIADLENDSSPPIFALPWQFLGQYVWNLLLQQYSLPECQKHHTSE